MIKTVTVAIGTTNSSSNDVIRTPVNDKRGRKSCGKTSTKAYIKCKQRGKYLIIVIFIHVLIDFVSNTCWIAVMLLYMLYLCVFKYIYTNVHMFTMGIHFIRLCDIPDCVYNPPMTIIKCFSHTVFAPCYSVRLLMARITSCM